ncbi:MarR family transcriptional regulator [Mycobacterium sp.]|uniref:MarR family winged helix-turn-helix transcriptional regulator n=1 Tax=Mycobacterium sp. TaxID=1785 RepID=UPI0025FCE4C6|nr:MarR family transcriptional regulator [Mycobacterium sp.]
MGRRATRRDLAEMLTELARQTVAAEMPALESHGLSMWGYVVLTALDRTPIRTQTALAEAIGADKTRIIPTLDELQRHGHIERTPDPDDRRARLLAITESGRAVKDAVQADIQRGEEQWLGTLSANEREMFLRVLNQLSRREAD